LGNVYKLFVDDEIFQRDKIFFDMLTTNKKTKTKDNRFVVFIYTKKLIITFVKKSVNWIETILLTMISSFFCLF